MNSLHATSLVRHCKIGKIWFFWRKIVIFHMKYHKNFARPPKIGKIWFFGVKSWFFTRNTPKIFAPPSARRNFLNCAPPNLKSWIRPWNAFVNCLLLYSVRTECINKTWKTILFLYLCIGYNRFICFKIQHVFCGGKKQFEQNTMFW